MVRWLALGAGLLLAAVLAFLLLPREGENAPPESDASALPEPLAPPLFDIVRVDPDGTLVASGHAPGHGRLMIEADGVLFAEALTDARGEWVAMPAVPLAPGAHVLSLAAMAADGRIVRAGERVLAAIPAERGPRPLVVLLASEAAPRVLQSPAPPADLTVSIETIAHGDGDAFAVGGRAEPGTRVWLYQGEILIGEARADFEGHWSLVPARAAMTPGRHALRADALDREGIVMARTLIEVERPPPEARALPPVPVAGLTVEPGLWRLSLSGIEEGHRGVLVIEPSIEQAREPGSMLPGQVAAPPER